MALPIYGGGNAPTLWNQALTRKKLDAPTPPTNPFGAALKVPGPNPTAPYAGANPTNWNVPRNPGMPSNVFNPNVPGYGQGQTPGIGGGATPPPIPPNVNVNMPAPPPQFPKVPNTIPQIPNENVDMPSSAPITVPNTAAATPPNENVDMPAPTPVTVPNPAPPPTPPVTSSNLSDYKADPLTDAGKLYDSYVTDGLKTGHFGEVDAARGAADRNNLLRTTQATEAAQQEALRAGAKPGTSLWQAIMDKSMGTANQANLGESNQVNSLNRDVIQKALDRGQGIETQTYNRADAERAFATGRQDLSYERTKAEEAVAKGDQNTFLNSIQDDSVRAYAASQFAQGKSLKDVSAGIWSTDPSTGRTVYNPQIASLSPGKQNAANTMDYWTNLGYTPDEAKKIIKDMAAAQVAPITTGANTAKLTDIKARAQNQGLASITGDDLTTLLNGTKETTSADLQPTPAALRAFAADNTVVKLHGKLYETKGIQTWGNDKLQSFPALQISRDGEAPFYIVVFGGQTMIARTPPPTSGSTSETAAWQKTLENF